LQDESHTQRQWSFHTADVCLAVNRRALEMAQENEQVWMRHFDSAPNAARKLSKELFMRDGLSCTDKLKGATVDL